MKAKKRYLGFVILAAVMIILSAGCVEEKSYVVGVDAALSPWEFVDTNGNAQGAVVELFDLIAKDQGVTFTYVVPEDGLWEQALVSGEIDTEGTIVITPEREENYTFVKMPFAATRYTIIARADSGVTVDDVLAGRASLALFENSAYEQWAKKQFGSEYDAMVADGRIVLTDTADKLSFAVLSYEVDAAIAGSTTMGTQLNQYLPLAFVGYVGEPRDIGFVFRKNDTRLQNIISSGLSHVTDTPAFALIAERNNLQYKKDVYVVGIDEGNAPWTYLENGTYTGYDIEQIEWIAKQKGFDVAYKTALWTESMGEIITEGVDMWASSMAITPWRMEYAAFSHPYYATGIAVVVKKESRLTMDDLKKPDTTIMTVEGTRPAEWIEEYLGEEVFAEKMGKGSIVLTDDVGTFSEGLHAGTYDFTVADEIQVKKYADMGELKILYVEEGSQKFAIAMRNGDILLQDLINTGIDEFERSGMKEEMMIKYGL